MFTNKTHYLRFFNTMVFSFLHRTLNINKIIISKIMKYIFRDLLGSWQK